MYCDNCGKQIEEDSVYCRHCGRKVGGGAENPNTPPTGRRALDFPGGLRYPETAEMKTRPGW